MKRCWAILAVMLVAAIASGCGGSARSSTTSSDLSRAVGAGEYPEKLKVAFEAICQEMGHSRAICPRILQVVEGITSAKQVGAAAGAEALNAQKEGRFSGTEGEQTAASVKYGLRKIVEVAVNTELAHGSVKEESSTASTGETPAAPAAGPQNAESCGRFSNEALKSTLEAAANQAHLVGFSKSEGDCLTNIKVHGEWAAATWPAAQPQAMVFRQVGGRWQAITGGTAIDEGGREPVPKAVLKGEP
ncbi:MAG: hypothetical protein ACRDLF_04340 [Solirubrobacteraceae bacterium]